jgi:hypothetical protein
VPASAESAAPPIAGPNEACTTPRADDIEAVLGAEPVAEPLSAGAFGAIEGASYGECLWKTDTGLQVIVRMVRGSPGSDLKASIDSIWRGFIEYKNVTGIGDIARIHFEADLAAHVVAVKGSAAVYVIYRGPAGDAMAKRDEVLTLVMDTLNALAR